MFANLKVSSAPIKERGASCKGGSCKGGSCKGGSRAHMRFRCMHVLLCRISCCQNSVDKLGCTGMVSQLPHTSAAVTCWKNSVGKFGCSGTVSQLLHSAAVAERCTILVRTIAAATQRREIIS